ncbi:MAG: pyridoxal-phosphate dependent enzyme [Alphaproteobacteria bacterium]|nr:pyridoxal-phosphate dependent enzyme [Alphaproteobacteria bacterium]
MSSKAKTQAGILGLIGNTPMVELTQFDTGKCRLFVKLESQNPGGSIKDRIALYMIEEAEKAGRLKPGGTIIEATAGNTGLGLALIGALKGYKTILVVPDKMAREKVQHCKALGADVRLTRSDVNKGHPAYYQDMAKRLAAETGAFYIDQFNNNDNPSAHEKTTAPEIWAQMGGQVDAIVCGVGSGGTVSGLYNYFHKASPKTEFILADPEGSILAPLVNEGKQVEAGSWLVEGIGEDFVPAILNIKAFKKAYSISDEESFHMCRELVEKEGILAGASSGTLVASALRYCHEQTESKHVVTFICDRGDKYLSKSFSDSWLKEQGFGDLQEKGTVEDIIMRRLDHNEIIFVRPTDTLLTAYKRMRVADVSQLPVLDENEALVGFLTEAGLLNALNRKIKGQQPVVDVMETDFDVFAIGLRLEGAARALETRQQLIIKDNDKFVGLVTRVDLLNHLFLKAKQNG